MSHTQPQAIGLLGGTFDPIHFGHLRMALEIYEAFSLAKIHILPSYQPMYRSAPMASVAERWDMVQRAVENGGPAFIADDRELKRKGPTYTIDTLIAMRAEMPATPLCLLLGMDAFLGLPSWHRWEEILEYAHLIIAHRPKYPLPKTGPLASLVEARRKEETAFFHEHTGGGIASCTITSLEISSTAIRKQIAMGGNPRYLLPDPVYDYIQQHGTYR